MYKVLIVDDEIMIRRGLSKIIRWEQLGFELAGAAGNAGEAIKVLENTCVDVLLTDISMPETSGLNLIRMAKEMRPGMKTVVISGYSEFDYAIEAIKLKVENYILKPLDPIKISSIFEKLKVTLDQEKEYRRKESYLKSEYELIRGVDIRDKEFRNSFPAELIQLMEEGRYGDLDCYVQRLFAMLRDNRQINSCGYCIRVLRNVIAYFHIESVLPLKTYMLDKKGAAGYDPEDVKQCFTDDIRLLTGILKENSENMAIHVSQQARRYVDEHYWDKDISLRKAAEMLGVSYGYLSTTFTKTFHENFKSYLVSVRIEKARELLLERRYKVYEIAEKVGYGSSRYFTDAFKKRYGISPVDYITRMNQGNQEEGSL